MGRDVAGSVRTQARRAERREQLLEDAVEAIRAFGPAATMEQLARQGGVTKPILYRHFADRDGLITAIAERFAVELMAEIQAALLTDRPAKELLESTVDAYLAFIEREPSLYRFLLQQAATRSAGIPQISPLIDSIARQVAIVIGDRLRLAGQDSGAAVPWSYGIVGLVHQAGDWWIDEQTMSRHQLVRYLTDLLWTGIELAATGPPRRAAP